MPYHLKALWRRPALNSGAAFSKSTRESGMPQKKETRESPLPRRTPNRKLAVDFHSIQLVSFEFGYIYPGADANGCCSRVEAPVFPSGPTLSVWRLVALG